LLHRFAGRAASDVDFFLEDEPLLHHENFFNHGDDRGFALRSDRRDGIDLVTEWDPFDLDRLAFEFGRNERLLLSGLNSHSHPAGHDATLFNDRSLLRDGNCGCVGLWGHGCASSPHRVRHSGASPFPDFHVRR
jgi:hypothetical protein